MFELTENFVTYGIQQGWRIELIVIILGFIGLTSLSLWIWRYFSHKDEYIIETMLAISGNLEQQSQTLETTTTLMRDLNENIKKLMAVDERLTEPQCVIVYSLMMDSLFADFKSAYYSVIKWSESRSLDLDDESNQLMLDDKLKLDFQTALAELDDQLRNFKFGDKYLHEYMNDGFLGEVTHIRQHIYSTIITDTNEIRQYLNRNCDRFKADFNKYLRTEN
tara:strand:- start:872 stop:1534 length:663 start_codon:yes stop_codon:yes gene_type:complete